MRRCAAPRARRRSARAAQQSLSRQSAPPALSLGIPTHHTPPPLPPQESTGNVHAYANVYGARCLGVSAQILPAEGFPEVYAGNVCVLADAGNACVDLGGNGGRAWPLPAAFHRQVVLYNNTFYAPGGGCAAGGTPFASYAALQAAGYEAPGGAPSVVTGAMPSADVVVGWGRALLAGAGTRVRKT